MRYTRAKSQDWVEFKPGAADLSMREIMTLYDVDAQKRNQFLLDWLAAYALFNRHNAALVLDSPDAIIDLTPKQFDWLRQVFVDWTRDEELAPEA